MCVCMCGCEQKRGGEKERESKTADVTTWVVASSGGSKMAVILWVIFRFQSIRLSGGRSGEWQIIDPLISGWSRQAAEKNSGWVSSARHWREQQSRFGWRKSLSVSSWEIEAGLEIIFSNLASAGEVGLHISGFRIQTCSGAKIVCYSASGKVRLFVVCWTLYSWWYHGHGDVTVMWQKLSGGSNFHVTVWSAGSWSLFWGPLSGFGKCK